MDVSREPLESALLHSDVVAALTLAAARREGPMTTLDILLALIDVDSDGEWSWLQLESTFVDTTDAVRFAESRGGAAAEWHGVPLSPEATEALARARKIADDYHLRPLPPGALALGLVCNRKSAAAR